MDHYDQLEAMLVLAWLLMLRDQCADDGLH